MPCRHIERQPRLPFRHAPIFLRRRPIFSSAPLYAFIIALPYFAEARPLSPFSLFDTAFMLILFDVFRDAAVAMPRYARC